MPTSPLAHKIAKAYAWTTAGNVVKNFAGFAISLVMAHILGPKEYGLLGMAMVFTSVLAMLQDFGVGQAVIYYQEERDALPLYFTTAVLIGGGLTAIAFAAAPLLAAFYREPAVTPIVRALSPTLLLGSLYSVAQGMLIREFDFRAISINELGSTVVAGFTGVVLALMGFGVWALVLNVLLSSLIQAMVVCYLVRPRLTLQLDTGKLKKLLRWGAPLTGSSLLWQVYENADYLVVGKLLGETATGYYSLAFRLATLVNSRVGAIINRVSFPTFSAVQKDHPELLTHWYTITERLGLIVFPLSAMLALNARDIVLVVLGPKWLPAVPPLQLLCIIGALKPLVSTMGNCMSAVGRTDLGFRFSLANSIFLPVAFVIACRVSGITGVAAAWCIVAPLTFGWFLVKTLRFVHGSVREYCISLAPGLTVAGAGAVVMYAAGMPFSDGILRLSVKSTAGVLVTLVAYWMHPPTRGFVTNYLPSRLRRHFGSEKAGLAPLSK